MSQGRWNKGKYIVEEFSPRSLSLISTHPMNFRVQHLPRDAVVYEPRGSRRSVSSESVNLFHNMKNNNNNKRTHHRPGNVKWRVKRAGIRLVTG